MNKVLEALLITSIAEINGDGDDAVLDVFRQSMRLIIEQKELFEEVPEKIFISSEELRDIEKNSFSELGIHRDVTTRRGESVKDVKFFFEHKAVMLKDRLHASAFGRMSYIYRSKGERFYLFEDERIVLITPYSFIDHNGFQLDNEIGYIDFSINEITDINELQMIFRSGLQDFDSDIKKRFICGDILEMLTNIKKPFLKDYYLEYLLTPPDVDVLSDFSKKIKHDVWDICLSTEFLSRWGEDIQNACMNTLSQIGISLTSGQIVAYIQGIKDSDTESIIKRLSKIEKILDKQDKVVKNDIVEFKPGLMGISINGNELYRIIKKWFSKQ